MIPRETIDRIFEAAKIEDVVGRYVTLKKDIDTSLVNYINSVENYLAKSMITESPEHAAADSMLPEQGDLQCGFCCFSHTFRSHC